MVVGRLLSYWEGNFSGAMLNFESVSDLHFGESKGYFEEAGKLVSWFITYLWDVQPTDRDEIIHLLAAKFTSRTSQQFPRKSIWTLDFAPW